MLATAAATPAVAAAGAPACTPGALRVSVQRNAGGGTAGVIYFRVRFHNVSAAACGLAGFPGVSVVSASGKQVGSPALRNNVSYRRVVIPAHGSAHALLGIVDWHNVSTASCRPVHVAGLRIYPPGSKASRVVAFPESPPIACSAKSFPGGTHTLVIGPVTSGA